MPIIQPDVFRYCNLCYVDSGDPDVLLFPALPIPNQMEGVWPTRKPPGLYELDAVLTAANYAPHFVTFRIDFKGGQWPAAGKFDSLITVEALYQGKTRHGHPVRR